MKNSVYLSRKLRKRQTKAEKKFWYLIRNRSLENTRFIRQHPIHVIIDQKKRFFIADFYCPEFMLVIEIDGKIHEKQKEYDTYRTVCLSLLDIQVVRYMNEEVIESPELVLDSLRNTLKSLSRQKRGQLGRVSSDQSNIHSQPFPLEEFLEFRRIMLAIYFV